MTAVALEKEHGFVGYEYVAVNARREMEQIYKDTYRSFGWEYMENGMLDITHLSQVEMKFRRDRKLKGGAPLREQQRKAEAALRMIEKLEAAKTQKPVMAALGVGLVGTAFLAGAVFAITGGSMLWCILLGIPGLVGWGLGYITHQKLSVSERARMAPLIDAQYDIIYSAGEEAAALLG